MLRGTGNCPLSSGQSTMIFEEAVPELLVGAGCSAQCGRVSLPFTPSLQRGAGGCKGEGLVPTTWTVVTLLFCPERCKCQLYTTEFYKKLLLKKVTDGRK